MYTIRFYFLSIADSVILSSQSANALIFLQQTVIQKLNLIINKFNINSFRNANSFTLLSYSNKTNNTNKLIVVYTEH